MPTKLCLRKSRRSASRTFSLAVDSRHSSRTSRGIPSVDLILDAFDDGNQLQAHALEMLDACQVLALCGLRHFGSLHVVVARIEVDVAAHIQRIANGVGRGLVLLQEPFARAAVEVDSRDK